MANRSHSAAPDISLIAQRPSEPATRPPDPTEPLLQAAPQFSTTAATSKNIAMQRLGEIATVFMQSPQHRQMTLAGVEALIVPAIAAGQFMIAEGKINETASKVPIGAVIWAEVSPDVDGRLNTQLEQPVRLQANEWSSGDHIWIVEAVGDSNAIELLMKRLVASAWTGKRVCRWSI